jgi:hypothetical protein
VVGPFPPGGACAPVAYTGPETLLYSDRPYHTRAKIDALQGTRFCRAGRHAREIWILDVVRNTTLYALASPKFELEKEGWRPLAADVAVRAAGVSFDTLDVKPVGPGRYVVHHGHTATTHPVFWRPADARIVRLPPENRG